ncbi:MAG: T9SS type A sorting domain-containing protein, partial [Bacteroidota bacterium]
FAYKHMGLYSAVTNEGCEIKIELNKLGSGSSDTFELFALYGGDAYMSANTIPEISGQSGTSLGTNPNFNSISGNQHTTADGLLPVELSHFSASSKNVGVELLWQTATEVNNHGFEIEKKQSNSAWTKIGFKEGHGTTNAVSNYSFIDNSAASGKIEYRLKQIDRDGKCTYSNVVEAVVGISPNAVELSSNYPNPFNPSTSISFMLGTTGNASLKVYDVLGKEVAVIANGMFIAGETNTFNFNAAGLTSGVYYYRLTSDAKVETRKMLLMK